MEHALLVGGTDFRKATQQVKSPCDVVVGTPGRVLDFLEKGLINPRFVRLLVSGVESGGGGGREEVWVAGVVISYMSTRWRGMGESCQTSKQGRRRRGLVVVL